ncbi:hypothetical protein D3C80_2019050 [compost metagenome]
MILRAMPNTSAAGFSFRPPESAIIAGATVKCAAFSKQKISATGTAAASPSASRARPGPI